MDMDVLSKLHSAIPKFILDKINDGTATAADLAVAVKFLKDNGVDCVASNNEGVASLAEKMNFPVDDDDDDRVVSFRR